MNTLKNLLFLNDDERLLAEVRTYQEKLISNAEEPIWERKWLLFQCKYNEDSGEYEAGSNARFCERSI